MTRAARITVLRADGHAVVRDDPFLPDATPTPVPAARYRAYHAPRTHVADRNVRTELARLRSTGAITATAYGRYAASVNAALRAERRLRGIRAIELRAVIENLHGIAARGKLTPSRLPVLFLTLDRNRRGGLTWEYYFNFDGGIPPWTSAMSQGTALQALTQTYEAWHVKTYLTLARRSLPIFVDSPPIGVSVRTRRGRRYLLYSFDPARHDEVINGFLQTLIGLFDFGSATGSPEGWRLFHVGDAEARAELPSYDTGSWSLYQPGVKNSLDYHQLVTLFLHRLCSRTHARMYCKTAARFERYLKHPPPFAAVEDPLTRRLLSRP